MHAVNRTPKAVILIAAHKPYRMPQDDLYLPVQAGAEGKESIGYQRDDEGENISGLNPFFCELTVLFWAWKNPDLVPADYIGLAHYRRHFASPRGKEKDPWLRVLKRRDLEKELGGVKVFVPTKRRYWIETLYSHYAHTHQAFQLEEAGKILREKYPEYAPFFDRITKRTWGYMFNMMILERSLLDAYCAWLFNILFELRKRLGEDGLTPFNRRYYGRIGEIIFNVWLEKQVADGTLKKEEVRELPLIHMEKVNWKKKSTAFLKAKFLGKKYESGF